jgi:ribosomal protein S18 acetylase RimI-like enzyme
MNIRKIASRSLLDAKLDDAIIEFDRHNMGPILAAHGIPLPEEKRRAGFAQGTTFIIGFDEAGEVIGYIEYGRDWADADTIQIASIQTDPEHRNGILLRKLLHAAAADLAGQSFSRVRAGVHKHNRTAIKMYRQLGFTIEDNPHSPHTYCVWAERHTLGRLARLCQNRACPR